LDFSALEQNIRDVVREEQIKLGYRKEVIRLYYPLLSLNRFLHTDLGVDEMQEAMEEFCSQAKESLGQITVSHEGERFCVCLEEEVSEFIHTHAAQEGFLHDFIHTVSRHGVTIDEVIAQFKRYSDCVHVEKVSHGEFDYLVYFEDGRPDAYRYCLTEEGCHIIYHRFTLDDYNDFQFEQ
jgi:hypothetical protein